MLNHNITYIIEGSIFNPRFQQQQNTIISCIYSLNYCKTFSTLRTLNVRETAIYLLQYLNKINILCLHGYTQNANVFSQNL